MSQLFGFQEDSKAPALITANTALHNIFNIQLKLTYRIKTNLQNIQIFIKAPEPIFSVSPSWCCNGGGSGLSWWFRKEEGCHHTAHWLITGKY